MKEFKPNLHLPASIDIHVPQIKVTDRWQDVKKHEVVGERVRQLREAGKAVGVKLRQPGKVTLIVAGTTTAIAAISLAAVNRPDSDLRIFKPIKRKTEEKYRDEKSI